MKIIALTDLHGDTQGLQNIASQLKSVDLILLSGDITHFGDENDAINVINEIKEFNGQIYAVAGNCDLTEVDSYLSTQSINLHGTTVSINGFEITGVGGSLPCPGRTPNEYSEQDLALSLNSAKRDHSAGAPLLLLAHQPPVYTINDRLSNGAHVGSESVRKYIEKEKPLICFTGHIHEGIGIDSIGPTKIVNPGPFRLGGYTVAKVGKTVEELEIRNWMRG